MLRVFEAIQTCLLYICVCVTSSSTTIRRFLSFATFHLFPTLLLTSCRCMCVSFMCVYLIWQQYKHVRDYQCSFQSDKSNCQIARVFVIVRSI